MKRYIIKDIVSGKFLQNINTDSNEHNDQELEYGAKLSAVECATLFIYEDLAVEVADDATSKTPFVGCFFTIIEIYKY